jgi:hypothetical protein
MKGGVAALKATVAPGPAPFKSGADLRVALPLLSEPIADRPNWTLPRLRVEIEARERVRISHSQLSKALRKKFRWRRPRHALKRGRGRTRQPASATAQAKRSGDFVAHLEQLDQLYGPKPGQPVKPVMLVEDNGPIHTSKRSLAALAARAHWLTVEWLSKYAPELNDIERLCHDLKANHPTHQTLANPDALDTAIHHTVEARNQQRLPLPLDQLRISAQEIVITSNPATAFDYPMPSQFSIFRGSGTRENALSLVTSTAPVATAWAAIIISSGARDTPLASHDARRSA